MPLALVLCFSCSPDAFAQSIEVTGDITPTLPADGALADDLSIGDTGTGSLSILNGAFLSNWNATLGNQTGSDGAVTVSGTGPDDTASTWSSSGYLEIGYYGHGRLTIENAGAVTSAEGYIGGPSGGAVEVTGAGSSWTNTASLVIGNSGEGTLTIADGGRVANTYAIIGHDAAGNGEVIVTGATSNWSNSDRLTVGNNGTGRLRIEDRATVTSVGSVVGSGGAGEVIVTGGATWTNTDQISVGNYGSGTLTIQDGGVVSSTYSFIGASSTGVVSVTGIGSSWVSDDGMVIGNYGAGTLTVADGGHVHSSGLVALGLDGGASGTLTLSGSAAARSVLETGQIHAGQGSVDVSIDGGILRATGSNADFTSGFGSRGITIGANGAIIDTAGFDIGISANADGSGSLDKVGSGTLTITGANSYAGGTTISEGTLQLGDGGASGSIAGDVVNDGTLAFGRSDASTFDGVVSGSGELHQIGSGTTTLTATNSYDGVTHIVFGTLALGGAGTIASSSNVIADGVFDISATDAGASIVALSGNGAAVLGSQTLTLTGATGSFGGTVSGAGTLNKAGTATWTLTGAGSQIGTLDLQAGALEINSGASFGAQTINVAAGTTVRNVGTFGGTALADVLTLNGTLIGRAEMFGGDDRVVIADGVDLSAAHFDGGAGVDTLELTHGVAMTYGDTLAATFEHLIKRGNGALMFEGAVNGFSDSITIAEGSAHLSNAQLHSNHLHVSAGTALTGVGSISGGLTNDGVLSAGNSPGTIQVGGSFIQNASGTLVSEIQRNGNDLVNIAGTATLAGTHRVQIDYGLYLDGTTHAVLQTADGVSGAFETVEINPSVLMAASHQIGSNDVTVSFERQSTTTVTTPGTGRDRFATWLDDQIAGGVLTPELSTYIDTLLQQPTAAEAENLLGELAEPIASVVQDSVSILGAGFVGAVFDRFAVNNDASCTAVDSEKDEARNCAWIRGLRQWGDVDGDRFGPRYDRTTNGVQIGADHTMPSAWTLGISAGYAGTDTHDVRGGSNDLRSTLGAVYTNYVGERIGFGAVAMYAAHENRTLRNSTVGTDVRQARAEFDFDSLGIGLRVDYRLTSADRAMVRPFVEAFYDRLDSVSFAEQGAATGNLDVQVHEREGLRGTVGVQFADDYEGYGLVFRPMLAVGVVRQFLDTQSTLDLYPFGSTPVWRAYSVQQDRTSYRANASLGVLLGSNAMLSLGYGGEVATDRSQHEVNMGFRVVW